MRPSKKWFAQSMRRNPTPGEARMWLLLRMQRCGVSFRRQVPAFGYILDFYSAAVGLAVEVDGSVHNPAQDAKRDADLGKRGIRTLRFTNRQVLEDSVRVADYIRSEVVQRQQQIPHLRELRRAAVEVRDARRRRTL